MYPKREQEDPEESEVSTKSGSILDESSDGKQKLSSTLNIEQLKNFVIKVHD